MVPKRHEHLTPHHLGNKLAPAYNKTSRKYLLCLHEKLAIMTVQSQNKKFRNSIQMQTCKQTSTPTF